MKKPLTVLLIVLLALTLPLAAACSPDLSGIRSGLQIAADLKAFGFADTLPQEVRSMATNWYYRALTPETAEIHAKSADGDKTLLDCTVICSNEILRVESRCRLTYSADWALEAVTEVTTGEVVLTVPESVDSVETGLFTGNPYLTVVKMEPLAGGLGAEAFSGCTALREVTLSDSTALLPTAAFKNCTALQTVRCADNTTAILQEAFSGCTALTDVSVGSFLEFIGTEAFAGCTALKNLTLPDSLVHIKDRAFLNCSSLKKFSITANLYSLGSDAFKGTDSLKVTVAAENEIYALNGRTIIDRALGDVITPFGRS